MALLEPLPDYAIYMGMALVLTLWWNRHRHRDYN